MGWMDMLCQTYDRVIDGGALEEEYPLVPVGFVQKRGNICVTLTAEGAFHHAEAFIKGENDLVVIPSTPEAEGRTSSPAAFPLCDQLAYVAGKAESKEFKAYMQEQELWLAETDAPPALRLLNAYLKGHRLIQDMRESGFPVNSEKDKKAMVCFRVLDPFQSEDRLWMREDVRKSWLNHCLNRMNTRGLCYVEGKTVPLMSMQLKVLGNAKLISEQDTGTIFQYKGRFVEADQALLLGYDASVKAVKALLWLLGRQGFNRYGMQAVAWAPDGRRMTLPVADEGVDLFGTEEESGFDTCDGYGKAVADAMRGYQRANRMDAYATDVTDKVAILALEGATPGRLSVIYYQEMMSGEYATRLQTWYEDCAWGFARFAGPKENRRLYRSVSTPTPQEIAMALYGRRTVDTARADLRNEKAASKLIRELKLRLLHCMVDGAALPRDMEQAAFHRVSAPMGFVDKNGKWQSYDWMLALSTYCALLRKWQTDKRRIDKKEKVIDVKLDETCTDRSFLYGRLLALADRAEAKAMGDNYRETNAFRYMQLFQQRPFTTWAKLHSLLCPYFGKLGQSSEWYKMQIARVTALFEPGDFESGLPLDGRYLQGYYCQRQALYEQQDKSEATDELNQTVE